MLPSVIIGITADDLTGAAAAAAAFARPGAAVPISLTLEPPPRREERTVFGLTTSSRGLPAEDVFDLVGESASALRMAGAGLIFKQLDANLRGSVGAELAAVFDTLGGPLLVAPAFPTRGRTMVGATVLVDGVPVAETEMGADPEAPARYSHLPTLMAEQVPDVEVMVAPLARVREGPAALRRLLRPQGLLVVDAETDADLDVIAEAILLDRPLPAAAGSAGLAAALARRLRGVPIRPSWPDPRGGPILAVVAGSSRALEGQIAQAEARSEVEVIPFPVRGLNREEQPMPVLTAASVSALASLRRGHDTLLHAAGPLPAVPRPVDLVVEHLAHLVFLIARQIKPAGLLVGGGAIAQAVLGVLGAHGVEIDDEPYPGIAAGLITRGDLADRPVVLKPGAAGHPAALVDLMHYLGRRSAAL